MEKGEMRKRERGEDILRSFICTIVLYLPPLLSSPLLSPRKPFDDSPPPLPLRDLRHIAFGMAVRGERGGSERGEGGGGGGFVDLVLAGVAGCQCRLAAGWHWQHGVSFGDGRGGRGGKPDVVAVPSLVGDGGEGGG